MKFNVKTVANHYSEQDKKKLERIGFEFVLEADPEHWYEKIPWRKVTEKVTIDIESLNDLLEFTNRFGAIIFTADEIEVYDDYRE